MQLQTQSLSDTNNKMESIIKTQKSEELKIQTQLTSFQKNLTRAVEDAIAEKKRADLV